MKREWSDSSSPGSREPEPARGRVNLVDAARLADVAFRFDLDRLTNVSDKVHFDTPGIVNLGRLFAAKVVEVLERPAPKHTTRRK